MISVLLSSLYLLTSSNSSFNKATSLVSSEIIPFNQAISSNNTTIEKREISKYLGETYSNIAPNLTSTRNYPKGSIILSQYTKQKACVLKDSSVDIIFASKSMNIKLRGRALKDGAIGDRILVKSDKYNKTYNGIIKSENEVIVRI